MAIDSKVGAGPGPELPTQIDRVRPAPGAPASLAPGTAATRPPRAFDEKTTSAPGATAVEPEEQTLDLAPGERVGQYEIIRELGRGGMGQVFMARDTKLGRLVAIKFLTRTGESFIRRFLVEAQTTARCTHENIVVIHEANTFRSHPYMVLELLDGDPLSKIIKGRTLSATRAVEILVPVVRALTRAHQFGIVHRDLKPDNIVITTSGTVKVLDFGVAKLFGDSDEPVATEKARTLPTTGDLYETLSTGGRAVGTLPFMSPEQFGIDAVDERTDLWAVGVILFRLLSGQHPLPEVSSAALVFAARDLDNPLRSLGDLVPDAPDRLIRVVDRCLRKRKADRYASADALLVDLEALLPARRGRRLGDDECPYPGLLAFDESDADRFFGRSREIARAMALVRDNALLGIVGPSGAGKSSFVRAGLIPELKASGATWETFILRPGRDPLASFVPLIEACAGRPGLRIDAVDVVAQLREEPGWLGRVLRDHARNKRTRFLLLVDQFEELYTLGVDADREAMARVLSGIADDPASPLRVVLSLRSDFLHRVAETPDFANQVMRGLLLLAPPDRDALREAAVGPAEKADYRFETTQMVDVILDELLESASPYPLLQFCLSTLWTRRDRRARVLRYAVFQEMGGVAGALATHADQVIATLSHSAQRVARAMFQRLVTSEATRAIVDLAELRACGDDRAEVDRVMTALVEARLLVLHEDTGTVEIIHEALVAQWPTLRRWMDESREDTEFVEQVRAASRQWEGKGKSADLLWRGAAATEAARFMARFGGQLVARDHEFLKAVIALERRSARRKTVVVGAVMTVLAAMVAASVVAMLWIRRAEEDARRETERAQIEARKAREAERKVTDQLEMVQRAESERAASAAEADKQRRAADMSREQLETAYKELEVALRKAEGLRADAERALAKAETARRDAQNAKAELQRALDREKAEVRRLEAQRAKIQKELK